MVNNKLWTRKELKEMNLGECKYDRMIEAVDKYIAENSIERINIWVHKISTKSLTTEQKIIFYYNELATVEENFIKGISDYSWTPQISELEFLATTPELKEKFIYDFLDKKGWGILCDISDFRKYIRNVLGRGKDITYEDLNACINYDDLKKSDWFKLNHLMQELYLKPCHVVRMELIYDSLMQGWTMQDIWAWYLKEPYHMFQFRMFKIA